MLLLLMPIPCHQVLELVDEKGGRQSSNSPMWDRDQLPEKHHCFVLLILGNKYSWQTIMWIILGNKYWEMDLHIGQLLLRL